MKTKIRRLFFTFTLTLATLTLSAIPAKRGQWQIITLENGKEIRAQLMGDEHLHFWQSEDGHQYTLQDDGTAMPADMEQMRSRAAARRAPAMTSKRMRSPLKVSVGDRTNYSGQKKGIVILMQFKNSTKFNSANNQAKYNDLLNKENYVTGSFKGSVADYFKAQSNGKFELTFDVVGPYEAKNAVSYYGSNDAYGNDARPEELIVEAVKAADSEVDFKDYDWDGDGQVDQVFVVYAGKGEANGGSANTIWPHMWWLSKTGKSLSLDSVKIDSYACSNELSASGALDGIGCFCHEFSHCLGYPDFYDIFYNGWFGMSQFDLMDQGCYNGNSFRPAGYTAYEKWMAGWIEPTVLADEDVTVENLKATSENGDAYIMYNDACQDEYYMIENRQLTKWDTNLPSKGLMITHVDFDKEIWEQNTPNTRVKLSDVLTSGGEMTKVNDHQRYTIFHADNNDDSGYWNNYGGYYTRTTLENDLYPYEGRDSLTATSKPAATLFNTNSKGSKYMQGAILKIKQNSDKTMSFFYRSEVKNSSEEKPDTIVKPDSIPDRPVVAHGDTIFYESFDKCGGTGGNDGKWDTTIAGSSSKFVTDNEGWEYLAGYGGYQCARFGNSTKLGEVTTPPFYIDGEAVLTFRATEWNNDGNQLALSVTDATDDAGITIEPRQLTMNSFDWKDFTVTLKGKGNMKLTFTPQKRFLLDEVLIVSINTNDSTIIDNDSIINDSTITDNDSIIVIKQGDVNGDNTIDVADIATVIDVMASIGTEPEPEPETQEPDPATLPDDREKLLERADVNHDGKVDVADIATIISIMTDTLPTEKDTQEEETQETE